MIDQKKNIIKLAKKKEIKEKRGFWKLAFNIKIVLLVLIIEQFISFLLPTGFKYALNLLMITYLVFACIFSDAYLFAKANLIAFPLVKIMEISIDFSKLSKGWMYLTIYGTLLVMIVVNMWLFKVKLSEIGFNLKNFKWMIIAVLVGIIFGTSYYFINEKTVFKLDSFGLTIIILSVLVEELILRGILQTALFKISTAYSIIMTSALYFAFGFSLNLVLLITLLAFNLIQCFLYNKSKNILIPTFSHLFTIMLGVYLLQAL